MKNSMTDAISIFNDTTEIIQHIIKQNPGDTTPIRIKTVLYILYAKYPSYNTEFINTVNSKQNYPPQVLNIIFIKKPNGVIDIKDYPLVTSEDCVNTTIPGKIYHPKNNFQVVIIDLLNNIIKQLSEHGDVDCILLLLNSKAYKEAEMYQPINNTTLINDEENIII